MTVPIGSIKLKTKDSPMSISTHIDWLALSEDEFDAYLKELRSSVPGFSPSMLSPQECQNFCSRRHQFLGECMDKLAELIGDTDLVSVTSSLIPSIPIHVTGVPIYVTHLGNEFLQLPSRSQVALDTQLLVYIAQKGVLKFKAEVEAVYELLRLPLDFVIGISAFTEVQYVLMRQRVYLPGIIPRVSSLMVAARHIQISSLAAAKSILIALVRLPLLTGIPLQIVKVALGWVTERLNYCTTLMR